MGYIIQSRPIEIGNETPISLDESRTCLVDGTKYPSKMPNAITRIIQSDNSLSRIGRWGVGHV